MNDIIKAMKERRSIRAFKPDMPSEEDLNLIIEAGLYAASGMGKQATKIIAVTNRDLIDKLRVDNRNIMGMDDSYDPFYGAPALLIVLADKECFTGIYDGSLVMGNMMLAAHSLGLGSIWIHRAKEEFEMESYKELLRDLGIDGEWEGIGHCAVGYSAIDLPEAPERKEGRVFRVR